MLAETYGRIRSAIVAFAPKYPPGTVPGEISSSPLANIIGTGFIVGDSLVATNRHVVEAFAELPRSDSAPDEIPAVAIFFTKTPGGLGVCLLNVCDATFVSAFSTEGHYYGTELPDVALVSLKCRGLTPYALTCDCSPVVAGTEIATAGFPLGSTLLSPTGSLERFGPVLQRGIISAEFPFYDIDPHAYLIDVMVQPGASGSPVFLPHNGHVIGVVFATQREPGWIDIGENNLPYNLPTSFSYVVPSTILCKLIATSAHRLMNGLLTNTPTIREILNSMPTKPVDKITFGLHRPPDTT